MSWLFPAVLSTLLGSVILCAAYGYLFAAYRERFLGLWAAAWGVYVVRYLALLSMLSAGKSPLAYFVSMSAVVGMLFFLTLGTAEFVGRKPSGRWLAGFVAVEAWVAVAIFGGLSFHLLTVPLFGFMAVILVWTGWTFLRSDLKPSLGKRVTGVAFIVWGLHQADYPLLRPVEWFAPYGYLIGTVCAVTIALGILLVYFDEVRARLTESTKRVDYLFRNAPDPILLHDDQGRILDANDRAETFFGYSRDELLTLSVGQISPEAVAGDEPRWKGMEPDRSLVIETRHRRKDGSLVPVEVHSTALEWDGRQCFLGFVRDLASRRKAETRLRESEALYRAMFSGAPYGIALAEPDTGILVDCNRALCDLVGRERAELIGRPQSILHPPDEVGAGGLTHTFRHHASERRGDTLGARVVTRSGELRDVEIKATPVEVRGRTLLQGFFHDVTARKEAERDLSKQRDHLERAEQERARLEDQIRETQKLEAIGTLAGGIAHDFNNILGAILGYSELALLRLPKDSKVAEDLGQVVAAGMRARDLVQQILAFSRRGDRAREPIQTHLVVGEALRLLRQTLPSSISIEQAVHKVDDIVLADPTQLHQVVVNLCTNAHHAMGGKGGTLTVALEPVEVSSSLAASVADLEAGPHVRLTVSDTGAGMSPETRRRVFEPFFTTKPRGEGTGLGLAVVHGIVRSHGGVIRIESELGRGTRIDVYLPRHLGAARADAPVEAPPPRGAERIVVVDDEPALARMTGKMLESLGYRVRVTTTSDEALSMVRAAPGDVDLVLTDQTMPGMTGDLLTRKLLEVRPELPIVICTGYSATMDEGKALALGAKGFLLKPLDRAVLAKKLRAVLGEAVQREG